MDCLRQPRTRPERMLREACLPQGWYVRCTRRLPNFFGFSLDSMRVVGFHYLGPNAGEVTNGYAVAMRSGNGFFTLVFLRSHGVGWERQRPTLTAESASTRRVPKR